MGKNIRPCADLVRIKINFYPLLSVMKFLSGTSANANKTIKIIMFVCKVFSSKMNFDKIKHIALKYRPHIELIEANVARSLDDEFS